MDLPQIDHGYLDTKHAVLDLMRQTLEQGVEKLPPEEQLAGQLNISRGMLRNVLADLEKRGYINRCRGRGTVINIPVYKAKGRIDEQVSFMDLIREKQAEPSVRLVNAQWLPMSETEIPQNAEIRSEDAPVLMLERICFADEVPVIYNKIYYRASNFRFDYEKWPGYGTLSTNEFLELFCKEQPDVTITDLDQHKTNRREADCLNIAEGETLFRMHETRYGASQRELVHGYALFCPQILPLRLVYCNSI